MADPAPSQSPNLAQLLRAKLKRQDLRDLRQLFGRGGGHGEEAAEDYAAAFDGLLPLLREQKLAAAARATEVLFSDLMQQTPERRRFLVENSARYQVPRLAERLSEQSLETCFQSPSEAVHLAELAVEIAERLTADQLPEEGLRNDLKAKAWAFLGNASRAGGDPRGAEQAFVKAEAFLDAGSGDLLQQAQFQQFRGALQGDQGHFVACFRSFDRAIRIYAQCGEDHGRGRAMVYKALFYGYAGRTDDAIDLLQAGIALADGEKEPRLTLAAHHNLILFLTDQGRADEARERLEEIRPKYFELGDRINLLRLRWLEGRIARESGDLEEAENAFLETKDAFLEEKISWDAAFVSLELASLYVHQGRTAEISRIADEVLPLFQATGQQREALAAVILFKKAADMDRVSEGLVRSTVSQLQSLRRDR